jgi:methionine sulfoxide reductase heme-binding subunit
MSANVTSQDWRRPSSTALQWVKSVAFLLACLPAARLLYGALTNSLGANPLEMITRSTGTWGLVFICIGLTITPLRRVTGAAWLLRLRRMFGLFAFFYVCLHLTSFVWFDHFFDLGAMIKDIFKRPFVTVGMAAFVLLLPLAFTSSDAQMRRLGRIWGRIHKLVYLVAVLGVIHYWWLVKKDLTQPMIYGAVVALLLGYRLVNALKNSRR